MRPIRQGESPFQSGFKSHSHKRFTFVFTGESGYTLAFANRIAHSGLHGETRGVLDGGRYHYPRSVLRGSETLRGRMSERQTLPLLGLGRGESRRTRRACGTAMRSCASLSRGVAAPLGCVIPLLFLSQQRWVSRFWSAASLAYRKLSACSLVTAVRFLTAKNGVDYKFSLHFLPGLWYTCLRNKCHAISTVCLQLRDCLLYTSSFRLGGRQPTCISKNKNHSKIHPCQVQIFLSVKTVSALVKRW